MITRAAIDGRVEPNALNIALVCTQSGWHGGELQAQLLADGLRGRGHRVTILAPRGSEFARRLQLDGFPIITFHGRGRNPFGIWELRRCLADLRPDVIHMNDSHALTSIGLALLGKDRPASVVSRRVDFPVRSAARYRLWSDLVLCVSQAVARECERAGLRNRLLQVIPDGCDPDRVSAGNRARGRARLGAASDERILLTVAKLTDHKGHRFLLEALPTIRDTHPRVRLILAGDGELRDELQQLAAQLGISNNVDFLGYRTDIPDLLRAADLFVMPSRLEGLCSSLIDAMVAQLPIVATTAGGIPDLVGRLGDDAPVALLADVEDSESLATAITQALNAPSDTRRMAQRAHQRALRYFTADCMVNATLNAYRDVVPSLA